MQFHENQGIRQRFFVVQPRGFYQVNVDVAIGQISHDKKKKSSSVWIRDLRRTFTILKLRFVTIKLFRIQIIPVL